MLVIAWRPHGVGQQSRIAPGIFVCWGQHHEPTPWTGYQAEGTYHRDPGRARRYQGADDMV